MRFKDYLMIIAAVFVCALLLRAFVVDAVFIPSHSMESTLLPGDYIIVDKLVHGGASELAGVSASFFHLPGMRHVEAGDVIVFRLPENAVGEGFSRGELFVKRCIAVGGDQITLKDGVLYTNGREVMHVQPRSEKEYLFRLTGPLVIPKKGDRIDLSRPGVGLWIDLIEREGHTVDTTGGSVCIDGQSASWYTVKQNYLFVLGDNRGWSYDSAFWGLLPEGNVVGEAEMIYWSQGPGEDASHWSFPFTNVRWNRIGTIVR